MASSRNLEFGCKPWSLGVAGVFVCLAGTLFVSFGACSLLLLSGEYHSTATALGIVFLLLGALAGVTGVMMVIRRKRLRIVLSDQSVRVGRVFGTDDIPYGDIREVARGLD